MKYINVIPYNIESTVVNASVPWKMRKHIYERMIDEDFYVVYFFQ